VVDVFRAPASEIDFAGVREFVLAAEASDALTESRVLELKGKLDKRNVVKPSLAWRTWTAASCSSGCEKTHTARLGWLASRSELWMDWSTSFARYSIRPLSQRSSPSPCLPRLATTTA
jgi:hypothetical protein